MYRRAIEWPKNKKDSVFLDRCILLGIQERESIRKVDAMCCKLVRLPRSMLLLSNLRILDLGGNTLTLLPVDIYRLGRLEELRLSHNHLCVLPPSLGNMVQLRILLLVGNCLDRVSPKLTQLTALDTLDLRGNFSIPSYLWQTAVIVFRALN